MHGSDLQLPRNSGARPSRRESHGLSSADGRPNVGGGQPAAVLTGGGTVGAGVSGDYPPNEREVIQRRSQEKLRMVRRLREYRIDPEWIRDGTLVRFGDILYGGTEGRVDSESFLDQFEHEGVQYFVDDLYCPRPECRCDDVHLAFIRRVPSRKSGGRVAAEHRFLAKLSFDGRAEIVELHGGPPSEAKAVLSAWQERYGNDLEELRWRDQKVKEIAQRSIPARAGVSHQNNPLPKEPAPASVRIGRNDPCPCGSGRKFKKCCGQRKDILPRPR